VALGPARLHGRRHVGAGVNVFFGQALDAWQMLAWEAWASPAVCSAAADARHAAGARRRRRRPGAGVRLVRHLWMYIAFSAHSWPALVALYAQGLPFDVAHVTATCLFAGLFGVQAVRIVARFRVRTRVTFVGLEDLS
jgi:hypothetical protein